MLKKTVILMLFLLGGNFFSQYFVNADADDHHKHERYKEHKHYEDFDDYEDHEDYDDDHHDYEEYYDYYEIPIQKSTWNIWLRETSITKGELPFTEARKVLLKCENSSDELLSYVIPSENELFVAGQDIARLLGAESRFYPTSQILELTTIDTELIFRSGTNVAYENNIKTPIPAKAFYMNQDLYLPISVISNGLGFIAEWQDDTLIFKKFNN